MTPPVATPAKPSHESIDLIALRPEQLFSAIFEQVAVGIALIETATGRFIQVNQHYCDIVGLSKAQLLATTVMAITHPDDLQPDLDHMEKLRAGQIQDFLMEQRYYRADGTVVWVELTVSPFMRGEDEAPSFHTAVVRDITARKQRDEQARRWDQVFAQSHIGLAYISCFDNTFLAVNQTFACERGYTVEELLGKPIVSLYPPEAHQRVNARIQDIDRHGHLVFETVHQRKDGTTFPVLLEAMLIKNEQGQIISRVVYAQDITKQKRSEQALRESEQRLRQVLEETSTAVWDWDVLNDKVFWTPQHFTMLGYEPGSVEPSYANWAARVHPEDLARTESAVRDAMEQRREYRHQFRALWPDGTIRWIEAHGTYTYHLDGHCTRMVGLMQDITERKQAEQDLRDRERQLQMSLEASHAGTWSWDLVRNVMVWDHRLHQLYGFGPEERPSYEVWRPRVHSSDLPRLEARIQLLQQPSSENVWHEEFRIIHPEKGEIWVEALGEIERNPAGQAIYFAGINLNITERKNVEERLQRAHDELECRVRERTAELERVNETLRQREQAAASLAAIVTSSDDAIIGKDLQGIVTSWNQGAERLFGYTAQEMIGHPVSRIIPLNRQEEGSHILSQLAQGERIDHVETIRQRKDGTNIIVSLTVSPVLDAQGRILGVAKIARDITDRKRAERSNARMMHAIAYAGDLVMHLDGQGRFLYVNEVVGRLLGYVPETMLSMRLFDVGAPLTSEEYFEWFQRAADGPQGPFELLMHRTDGFVFPVELVVSRVDTDEMPILLAIGRDISARREAELKVRQSEQRFQLVAQVTDDVLWDLDLLTDRLWWSPNAQKKFGCASGKEPTPAEWQSRLHPLDRERVVQHLYACLKSGERLFTEEYQLRLVDGQYRTFQDLAQVVYDAQGKPVRMIGTMVDITTAKQQYVALEHAYARLQRMSRELQMAEEKERRHLAHELHDEFGQLLSALRLSLGQVCDELGKSSTLTGSRLTKYLAIATKTVEQLFLSQRELVQGLRPAILEELGLVAALQAMADTIQETTGIVCRISTELEPVQTQIGKELEGTLYRIVQELVTNVVRHAKATKAQVSLYHNNGTIVVVIQDNGQGLDVHRARVKNRFGLRGVQERAELLGGALTIDSTPKVGTTVTVCIPIEVPLSPAPQMNLDRLPRSRSPRKRPRRGR